MVALSFRTFSLSSIALTVSTVILFAIPLTHAQVQSTFQIELTKPAVVSITVDGDEISGCVNIEYGVADRQKRDVDIVVEYFLPEAGVFRRATQAPQPASNGIYGVSSSNTPGGTLHQFAWDSVADIPNTQVNKVKLRITPYLSETPGTSKTISELTVNNKLSFNSVTPVTPDIAPLSTKAADLNRDGREDVALCDALSGGIVILLGDGQGGFSVAPGSPIVLDGKPLSLDITDLNRDGVLDIATCLSSTSEIASFVGVGDGTFLSAGQRVATGQLPTDIRIGDFDIDGIQDVAVSCWQEGCISIHTGVGDGTFTPGSTYDTGIGTSALDIGDVNKDGAVDVVVLNSREDRVVVLSNDGSGLFTQASTIAVGEFPTDVVVADFSKDGKLDIVTANYGSSNLSLLLGDGTSQFAEAATSPLETKESCRRLVAGDFDKDGTLDVVAAGAAEGILSVHQSIGTAPGTHLTVSGHSSHLTAITSGDFDHDGSLDLFVGSKANLSANTLLNTIPAACATGFAAVEGQLMNYTDDNPYPSGCASGDFNNDGHVDIVVANENDSYESVLLGIGGGKFDLGQNISIGPGWSTKNVYTGHFDNDNNLDLLFTRPQQSPYASSMLLFCGEGDGTFTLASTTLTAFSPQNATIGDFNADGALDFAVHNIYDEFEVFLGNNDGTFTLSFSYVLDQDGKAITCGDIDNDGDIDLAVACPLSTKLFLGDNTGQFTPSIELQFGPFYGAYWGISFGDFNNDGNLDLFQARSWNGQSNYIALGIGDGSFLQPSQFTGSGALPPTLLDFNLDGNLDVVEAASNGISVHWGDGAGNLLTPTNIPLGTYVQGICAADFNSDGYADIAVTRKNNNDLAIAFSDGQGSFEEAATSPTPYGNHLYFSPSGDLNGDGMDDFVVGDMPGGSNVSVLTSDGLGNLTVQSSDLFVVSNISDAALGDVNNDGVLDLLGVSDYYDDVAVLLGDGTANFGQPTTYPVGPDPDAVLVHRPGRVYLQDVNKDGWLDIITANESTDDLSVLLNDGTGSFLPPNRYEAGDQPQDVEFADINGDGAVDFVVADRYTTAVHVSYGNGDGTFQSVVQHTMSEYPRHISVADYNNDGSSDILVVTAEYLSSGAYTLHFLENDGTGTFTDASLYDIGRPCSAMDVQDMDRNGTLDIVLIRNGYPCVLYSDGFGNILHSETYPMWGTSSTLVVNDLNQDGKWDVVAGFRQQDSMAFYEGR